MEKIVISWSKIEALAKEFEVGVAYIQGVLNATEPSGKEKDEAIRAKALSL